VKQKKRRRKSSTYWGVMDSTSMEKCLGHDAQHIRANALRLLHDYTVHGLTLSQTIHEVFFSIRC
jgi:hypothetical protein